jgi:hypothetical protein
MGAHALRFVSVLFVVAVICGGCMPLLGASVDRTVSAPSWEHAAFGPADADFVGAIDLEAVRADPLFGPLLQRIAERDEAAVLLHASQIDVVASVDAGEPKAWVLVAHGVTGAPTEGEVGADARRFVTGPDVWIYGHGPAFERMRNDPTLAVAAVDMPAGALVAATARAKALKHPRHLELGDLSEGLTDVTAELLGGDHLGFALSCRYADDASARRAAAMARLVLVAEAQRNDDISELARALMKLDFNVDGPVVSMRVTLSDDLREALVHYVQRAVR